MLRTIKYMFEDDKRMKQSMQKKNNNRIQLKELFIIKTFARSES